jgi:hypothetical protein
MLAPQLKQWESEGRYLKTVLFQHKVFCKDARDPAAPPERTLLLLHGFPESSFSFHKVVEGLAKLFDRIVSSTSPATGSATSRSRTTPTRCSSRPTSRCRCGKSTA